MPIAAASLNEFWDQNGDALTAALSVAVALVAAWLVSRAIAKRDRALATTVTGGLSPVAETRLRFIRHLITFTIVLIGVALALAQFTSLQRLATGLLASSAIVAAIVGFAAQTLLANVMAGVTLAISQLFSIGDHIELGEHSGEVEQLHLTHTYLRGSDGERIVIPNQMLTSEPVRVRPAKFVS